MTFNDILKESWLSISGNKIRSFLTILGIIIGVMAVVIMMSVGDAVQKQITDQFSNLGTNTIMIRAGAMQRAGVRSGGFQTLTIQDAAVLRTLPDIDAVTPVVSWSTFVYSGSKNWVTTAFGAEPDYQIIQNIEMDKGVFFDQRDSRDGATKVIIGPEIAKELELPDDPIGTVIRVFNVPVTITGVMKSRGGAGMSNPDDMVILPMTTVRQRLTSSRFPDSVQQIMLRLSAGADNALVVNQITQLLRDRHHLKDDVADDFQITDMKQIMDTMNSVTGMLKLLLMSIAAVSLLVGSIGIMNMMLVSVAERTREIGIRKAIGAKEGQIMTQFLSESVMISFMGSMIGMILGIVLSQTVLPNVMKMPVPVSLWSIVLSVAVAGIVGIASGVMPANKAAKMNPIDSLRFE